MDDLKKMIYGKQDYYLDFLSKLVGFDTSVMARMGRRALRRCIWPGSWNALAAR